MPKHVINPHKGVRLFSDNMETICVNTFPKESCTVALSSKDVTPTDAKPSCTVGGKLCHKRSADIACACCRTVCSVSSDTA